MSEEYKINWLNSSAGIECACGEDLMFDHESEPKTCPKCGRVFVLVCRIIVNEKARYDEYMGEDKLWPDGSIGPDPND